MKKDRLDKRELVTLGISSIIIIVALGYWAVQIDGVMEMLEMAYG